MIDYSTCLLSKTTWVPRHFSYRAHYSVFDLKKSSGWAEDVFMYEVRGVMFSFIFFFSSRYLIQNWVVDRVSCSGRLSLGREG